MPRFSQSLYAEGSCLRLIMHGPLHRRSDEGRLASRVTKRFREHLCSASALASFKYLRPESPNFETVDHDPSRTYPLGTSRRAAATAGISDTAVPRFAVVAGF